MDIILAAILSVVIGMLIGVYIEKQKHNISDSRENELENQIKQKDQELAQYQEQVDRHFSKTAEMFSGITQQYKELYTFMAEESKTLCKHPVEMQALEQSNTTKTLEAEEVSVSNSAASDNVDHSVKPKQAARPSTTTEANTTEAKDKDEAKPKTGSKSPAEKSEKEQDSDVDGTSTNEKTEPRTAPVIELHASKTNPTSKETAQPPKDYADEAKKGQLPS